MIQSLLVAVLLTVIIHTSETLSYSVRYAGVRMNKIAIALSLTGIIVLVSRTANMIQGPLTGHIVDIAKKDPSVSLLNDLRIILLGGSLGTLIAIGLFPTFTALFGRVISKLEIQGSIPRLLGSVTIAQLKNTRKYVKRPRFRLHAFRYLDIPKRLIVTNILVTGIYTTGVLATLYAGYHHPEHGTAISQASGLINGIATILLTVFIDPQLGLITDKATVSEEHRNRLGKVYMMLMGSRFLGTLLAQLLLVPAAWFIGVAVRVIL
ncbi:lipid II flippase Amj family protein [Paenibacillus sp. HN-1]|uniref:lipid II flippase Amj family protein n=1 Tax=Paenibacillus TaxID=44249 RepID=UPI001CAA1E6B|nr:MULTISPECIES: lipid II flippase Amj family protein [Paenibacillus]MBY9079694.1 lipid II flippase Amj family protein [Paenibacillus sp. CGMCC 1.18879]MBY9082945.1 lipid II flippase Amj family protein [Paenibacillus sinensis]